MHLSWIIAMNIQFYTYTSSGNRMFLLFASMEPKIELRSLAGGAGVSPFFNAHNVGNSKRFWGKLPFALEEKDRMLIKKKTRSHLVQ